MSLLDSLLVSVFGMTVVFLVLILLSALVKFQSIILAKFIIHKERLDEAAAKNKNSSIMAQTEGYAEEDEKEMPAQVADHAGPQWSTGELKLLGVDEKTAAMIMAIVSDETGISLNELQFKSIKALG